MFRNKFRNILYSEIYNLDDFDVLISSAFRVIQKIGFANLCKISVSAFTLDRKYWGRRKWLTNNLIYEEWKEKRFLG